MAMTHKELITDLSSKLPFSENEITDLLDTTFAKMAEEMSMGHSIYFQGFGTFEPHRKEERLTINPRNQIRTLIPPKQVVVFKPTQSLKDKAKEAHRYEN
jgi:DNA-binding protein HU-beta